MLSAVIPKSSGRRSTIWSNTGNTAHNTLNSRNQVEMASRRASRSVIAREAVREGPIGCSSQLHVLKRTHTIVVIGLTALVVNGLLLVAADADAFLHSRIFWVKMGLMGTLLI